MRPISSLTLEKAAALGSSYGILSTLFSGLAFWGLIWTILIQRNEIRSQRTDAKRAKISELLLNEADRCLMDINTVKFKIKCSAVFPIDKPFGQWQFFYHAQNLMLSASEQKITYEALINEITSAVLGNIEQLTYFYKRLSQACDVARYLLADSEVPPKELNEIKLLFFSRFSNDIFFLSGIMKTVMQMLLDRVREEQKISHSNPIESILGTIGSINEFKEQKIDDGFVRTFQRFPSLR